jgi:hypothetical protein
MSAYDEKFAAFCYGAAERFLPGYNREYFLWRARKWEAFAANIRRSANSLRESREGLARVRSAVSPVLPDSDEPIG